MPDLRCCLAGGIRLKKVNSMAPNRSKTTSEEKLKFVESLPDTQSCIDAIAEDLKSGRKEYAVIDVWKLADLLGVDFEDTGDWSKCYLKLKNKWSECCSSTPILESFHLLEGRVPPERFEELESFAEELLLSDDEKDLQLTKAEEELLRKAYEADPGDGFPDLGLATKTLRATNGEEVDFQVCIGDGGEPCEPRSPYDLASGKQFDWSDYLLLDQ